MNRALGRTPFTQALGRLPFLLRLAVLFLVWAIVFGGMSYYGGHSGPPYNGARTFGEAVKDGVALGTLGSLIFAVARQKTVSAPP